MRILIAVDSVDFNKVIADFLNKHQWQPDTLFRVIHVIEPELLDSSQVTFLPFLENMIEHERSESQKLVADLTSRIEFGKTAKMQVFTEVLEGHPRDRIVQTAREWRADLLVVGSHGRKGISRFTLGSVSSAVVALAPCSVVVLRLPPEQMKNQDAASKTELLISLS